MLDSGTATMMDSPDSAWKRAKSNGNRPSGADREVLDDAVDDPLIDGMNPLGAFKGVPFLMKDLGPTMKGRLQEMGSRFMQGQRANADSLLTQKMRAAGLNIIGRTSTPEFGVCSSAENPAICITRNPWDTAYSSCGSLDQH